MKQYRLLRNNKESGPYTAEELIQTGFKPYDLIWMDGKSAAWRYAGEMEEFKIHAPAIEEQPFDRFYKRPLATESKKETITPTSNINTTPSVAVRTEKPRIRIKADSRKIEEPVASEVIVPKEKIKPPIREERAKPSLQNETIRSVRQAETEKAGQTVTHPAWKDMWLDWEQEKKAAASLNKPAAKERPKEILETKFTQSLDEIKERYVETVLKPQKSSSAGKYGNYLTPLILTVAILGFGMWMGINWSKKSNENTQQKIANLQPQSEKVVSQNEEADKQTLPVDKDEAKTSEVSPKLNKSTSTNQTVPHNIKTTSVAKKSEALLSRKLKDNESLHQPKQNQSAKDFPREAELNEVAPLKNPPQIGPAENNEVASVAEKQDHPNGFTHFKPQPKITDFIAVDTYTPSLVNAVGVKLRVQNISDIPVDLAMIDLQYYDAAGKYQMGATVYVRNIGAGQTVTVPAPDNNHAAKLGYKISMISSERTNMYLIAD